MKYIYIGKILSTRGLKGELKVYSATDFQEARYAKNNPVYIKKDEEYIPVFVDNYRQHKGFDLLVFKGLEDINLVEKYIKCEIYSEDNLVLSKKNNEYHIEELIGLRIIQSSISKGKVLTVRELPQCDYLVIEKEDKSTSLIPFRDEFILRVDLINQEIEVVELEGLL